MSCYTKTVRVIEPRRGNIPDFKNSYFFNIKKSFKQKIVEKHVSWDYI